MMQIYIFRAIPAYESDQTSDDSEDEQKWRCVLPIQCSIGAQVHCSYHYLPRSNTWIQYFFIFCRSTDLIIGQAQFADKKNTNPLAYELWPNITVFPALKLDLFTKRTAVSPISLLVWDFEHGNLILLLMLAMKIQGELQFIHEVWDFCVAKCPN
jgi:hypothetical protein